MDDSKVCSFSTWRMDMLRCCQCATRIQFVADFSCPQQTPRAVNWHRKRNRCFSRIVSSSYNPLTYIIGSKMDMSTQPANRVFQLEALELDSEFNDTVDQLVNELGLNNSSEELKLVLKCYLYLHHISRNATVGMKLYGIKFCETDNDSNYVTPKRYKMAVLAICDLLTTYMAKRHYRIERIIDDSISKSLKLNWLTMDNLRILLKLFSIVNFFIFLRRGKHVSLIGNLFGLILCMPPDNYYSSLLFDKFQMEYMYRETMWRSIAEFLTTIIRHINTTKIKSRVTSILHLKPQYDYKPRLQDKISREKNMATCAICEKQPFNPYIIGCKHVFCYYCLHAKYLSDMTNGYTCSLCNYSTTDSSMVTRLNFNILSTNTVQDR